MTRPQHIYSYLVTCTNKTLWCSLTSKVKHLMLFNDKNHWSVIQQIWPLFDIKTSIHKGKIVSRNGKQKKTRQSTIRRKSSGTMEPERKNTEFVFSLTGKYNRTMILQNHVYVQKNLRVLLSLLNILFI